MDPIKKCRERIGKLLLIYGGVILLLVAMGAGNLFFAFVSGDSATLTDRILYAALPLFMWLYSQKAVSAGGAVSLYAFLEATQTVLLGVWVVLGVPFLAARHGAGMILFALIVSFVSVVLVVALLVSLFRAARKLVWLQGMVESINKGKGIEPREDPWYVQGGIIFLMLLCYLAPGLHLSWSSIAGMIDCYTASDVEVYDVGSYIAYMAGSPDGNLLALGTEKGLYVWDTRTRECVWSDDCLAVQRVRFSPGGRYLAAAGRGRTEGASDLAVYEVEGFRRLPGFDWPEHEEHKEKVFHDMVFRPDEETLLILWHRSWIWNRMSQGWDNDEAQAVKAREKSLEHKTDQADLFCTEVDLAGGAIGQPRTIRQELFVFSELSPEGSAYFSYDASRFVYPTNNDQSIAVFKWVHSVDRRTWEEQVFQLDGYFFKSSWIGESYFEWKLNRKGTKAYLLGEKEEKEIRVGVLLALDLKTGVKRDFPKKGKHLLLSQDERRIVMLAGDWIERTRLVILNFLDIETSAEMKVIRKFDKNDRGGPKRFVWLKAELFAVAMDDQKGSLVFIDLDKEGNDGRLE